MCRFTTIIASLAIVVAFSDCAAARSQGDCNISPRGEFSFRLESNGRVLPTYTHQGRTYVEGQYGDTYQIRVLNHTGQRVEAVVTVDSRNVVTGEVGDYRSQRGYIVPAWGSVLIDGFRKSLDQVAAFRFTDVADSYAARMGDATNVGIIGVAVFKEHRRYIRPRPLRIPSEDRYRYEAPGDMSEGESRRSAGAPSAKAAPSGTYRESDDVGQGLGTQYGEDQYSPVEQTYFERHRQNTPDSLLAIRYDDREGLIARGVLPRQVPPDRYRPVPNPFPNSPSPTFAPPPPPYAWEE